MHFSLVPLDFLNLLFVPLMAVTAVEVWRNRSTLWDSDLTRQDRYLLQRLAIFWLLPVVVFCHELGHVAAIRLFGGTVAEFHFALIWGYVVPKGEFTPQQIVWTFFAGNLAQMLIGFLAGAAAAFATSPPVVALLVYLALWSVGGTAIVYALLSLTGLYGDWVAIYTAPTPLLSAGIAVVHLAVAALVLWCLFGTGPKIWFISRTQPEWLAAQKRLWAAVAADPSAINCLDLARSFYSVGLISQAEKWLRKARRVDASMLDALMLEASISFRRGHMGRAIECYDKISRSQTVPNRLRARSLIALGRCQEARKHKEQALRAYTEAIVLDPMLADART